MGPKQRFKVEDAGALVASIRARSLRDAEAFWCGLDNAALEKQFNSPTRELLQQITPCWDLRPQGLTVVPLHADALSDLVLYLAPREVFLRHNRWTDIYEYETFLERSNWRRILRVIGHWQRRDALTPPVFALLPDTSKIIKVDGHHRTAVAVLSGSPVIPFYSRDQLSLDGIQKAPADLLTVENWTPSRTEA